MTENPLPLSIPSHNDEPSKSFTFRTRRILLKCFIASIATCAAIGIYCLLRGNIGPFEEKVLATTALIGATTILSMCGIVSVEYRYWRIVGYLSICTATLAFLLTLPLVWRMWGTWSPSVRILEKATGNAWTIAIALAHISLLSFARLRHSFGWIRRWTIISIALLVAIILLWVWLPAPYPSEELLFRAIGILAILDAFGTITIIVLHRFARPSTENKTNFVPFVAITCPKCSTRQDLPTGRTRCTTPDCGLWFTLGIESETCLSCGYSLQGLTSSRCPECGLAVAPFRASDVLLTP